MTTIIATGLAIGATSAAAVSLEIPAQVLWTIAGVLISLLLGKDVWQRLRRNLEIDKLVAEADQPPPQAKTPAGKRDQLLIGELRKIRVGQDELRAHVDDRLDQLDTRIDGLEDAIDKQDKRIERLESLYTRSEP